MTFVGRDEHLRLLDQMRRSALAGRGSLVLVTGDAGIGKSQTLAHFADLARAAGARVVLGRCVDEAGRPAYQPWSQIEQRLAADGLVEPMLTALADVADSSQAVVFEGFIQSLLSAAAEHDVVLLLEDLHVSSRDSLVLLRQLAVRLPESRLLVVASCRPVEAHLSPLIGDVLDDLAGFAEALPLPPLDESHIRVVLQQAGLPTEVSAAVHRRTSGNPLFVATAVRLLRSGTAALDAVEIPAGIRQAVRRQVAGASATGLAVQGMLEAASVIGAEFGLALLQVVHNEPDLAATLDRAVTSGALVEVPGAVARFAFSHSLVRETIYTDIPPGRRATLHARLLDAGDLLDVEEAAYHAVRAASAGRAAEAVDLSVQAADRARAVYAFETAEGHLRSALAAYELVPQPDPVRRCDVLTELAEVAGQAGHHSEARSHGLRAAEIASRHSDVRRRARALLAASERVPFLEHDDELLDEIDRCLKAIGVEPTPERARLLARRAVLATGRDDAELRDRVLADAVEVARQVADPVLLFDVLAMRMQALWGAPGYTTGLTDAGELLAVASSPHRRASAHLWALYHQLTACDLAAAGVHVAELERIAGQTGWGLHRLYAASRRATLETLTGDFDAAFTSVNDAYAAGHRAGEPEADAVRWGQLYTLGWHVDLGPDDLAFVRRVAQELRMTPAHRVFSAALAALEFRDGSPGRARQLLTEATAGGIAALPRDVHLPWLLALVAWLCAALGEPDLAHEVDDALAPYEGGAIVVGGAVQWMGTVSHYRGLAAKAYGDDASARRRLEDARRVYERMNAQPWVMHALRDLAGPSTSKRLSLRRDGDIWRLHNNGSELLLKDSLGLRYLDELLRNPGQEISAVALAGVPQVGIQDDVIDAQAKLAYRRRVADLQEEIEQAEENNDLDRASQARSELQFLIDELARVAGLGGRTRKLASTSEKARLNVTRAIRSALDKIAEQDPVLGEALHRAVRTGNHCSYTPST